MENQKSFTSDLTDIIFERRNHLYGAYQIRKGYNSVVQKSVLSSVFLLSAFVMFAVFVQHPTQGKKIEDRCSNTVIDVTLIPQSSIPQITKCVKPLSQSKSVVRKSTVTSVAPAVVVDEMVNDEKLMPKQTDFVKVEVDTKTQIDDVGAVAAVSDERKIVVTDIVDVAVENPIERDICSHPIVDDNAYTFVEEKPKFGNGYDDILSYISENIKYPDSAREMSIQGMIVLKFLVEKDGSVSNVHAIRGIEDASLREEAIRVVKNMPKWKAGRQNGVNVRVWYVLPILFKL